MTPTQILDRWTEGFISDGEALYELCRITAPLAYFIRIADELKRREKELVDTLTQMLSKEPRQ